MNEDSGETERPVAGLTRRETLKRGAIVGGALVWVTPVVQALTLDAAHADPASGESQPTPRPSPTTEVIGEKQGPGGPGTAVEGGKLPYTGSHVGTLGAVGLGVLATGAALGAAASRRKGKHAGSAGEAPAEN